VLGDGRWVLEDRHGWWWRRQRQRQGGDRSDGSICCSGTGRIVQRTAGLQLCHVDLVLLQRLLRRIFVLSTLCFVKLSPLRANDGCNLSDRHLCEPHDEEGTQEQGSGDHVDGTARALPQPQPSRSRSHCTVLTWILLQDALAHILHVAEVRREWALRAAALARPIVGVLESCGTRGEEWGEKVRG